MASGQTSNYGLNQWAAEDKVLREEFNQDNVSLDAALMEIKQLIPRIVTGTYTGNGKGSQFISLEISPKVVYVCNEEGQTFNDSGDYYYGGLAFVGFPAKSDLTENSVEIEENGFRVRSVIATSSRVASNVSGQVYYYVALA